MIPFLSVLLGLFHFGGFYIVHYVDIIRMHIGQHKQIVHDNHRQYGYYTSSCDCIFDEFEALRRKFAVVSFVQVEALAAGLSSILNAIATAGAGLIGAQIVRILAVESVVELGITQTLIVICTGGRVVRLYACAIVETRILRARSNVRVTRRARIVVSTSTH